MERVIPHDGDIYYDFKDLISAMTSNPTGTFILGRDISSRNVKPMEMENLISKVNLKENYLVQMIMLDTRSLT